MWLETFGGIPGLWWTPLVDLVVLESAPRASAEERQQEETFRAENHAHIRKYYRKTGALRPFLLGCRAIGL